MLDEDVERSQEIEQKTEEDFFGCELAMNDYEDERDYEYDNAEEDYIHRINTDENQEEIYKPRLAKFTKKFRRQNSNERNEENKDEYNQIQVTPNTNEFNYKENSDEQLKTVTVVHDQNKEETISTVSSRSIQTNLSNYTKQQLYQFIVDLKKNTLAKQDIETEEINEMTENQVLKFAKNELFKRVQFIRHKNVLYEFKKKGSIGRYVMKKLQVGKERRQVFWNTYRRVVREGIKKQRNVIHTNLRRKFDEIMRNQVLNKRKEIGNYSTYGMPTIEQLSCLRNAYIPEKGFDDLENIAPVIFFKLFMPCCGSNLNYNDKHHEKLLSDIYTPSQEGFVLIELINNYAKWTNAAQNLYETNKIPEDTEKNKKYQEKDDDHKSIEEEDTEKNKKPQEKDTEHKTINVEEIEEKDSDKNKKSEEDQQAVEKRSEQEECKKGKVTSRGTLYTNSRFCVSMDGWSEDGIKHYNKLCKLAERDRLSEKGKLFEKKFKTEETKKRQDRGGRVVINEDDYIKPYNNLAFSDDDDDDDSDADSDDEMVDDDEMADEDEGEPEKCNDDYSGVGRVAV